MMNPTMQMWKPKHREVKEVPLKLHSQGAAQARTREGLNSETLHGPSCLLQMWSGTIMNCCFDLSSIFAFGLSKIFLTWTIFKVFIECVIVLLLFYVLVFWP